jgi:hypothetical protein
MALVGAYFLFKTISSLNLLFWRNYLVLDANGIILGDALLLWEDIATAFREQEFINSVIYLRVDRKPGEVKINVNYYDIDPQHFYNLVQENLKRFPARRRAEQLIFKRVGWRKDDYDVLAGGVVVGRIVKSNGFYAHKDAPSVWKVSDDHALNRRAAWGRERTAEEAIAAFDKSMAAGMSTPGT